MKNNWVIQGGYRKYEEVTFLKGFAVFTIVLMHLMHNYVGGLPKWLDLIVLLGGSGVHICFFCSGFGLFLSYRHNMKMGYAEFLRKRMLQIYIPYIIVVLISFCIPLFQVNGSRIGALMSHIFLYKMFIPEYEGSFGGQFWYLSTTFQFYLLFIPLCRLKERLGNRSFGFIALCISVIWWIVMSVTGLYDERIYGSFFLQYLWEFCLGMIVADLFFDMKEIRISYSWLLIAAIVGLGLEGILGIIDGWLKAVNDIPALFGYGSLALLFFQIPLFRRIGLWIGSFSFELYLVHILIFTVIFSVMGGWVAAMVGLICSIIAAICYHRIIIRLMHIINIVGDGRI